MASEDQTVHQTTENQDVALLRRFLELSRGVRSISVARGKEEITIQQAMAAFERIAALIQAHTQYGCQPISQRPWHP